VSASNDIYSDTYHINVDTQVYQLQMLDRDEKTLFLLKRSGELLCTITMSESGWECDNDLTNEQLTEITKWITKLLYNQRR
jgi:hypothetical protein